MVIERRLTQVCDDGQFQISEGRFQIELHSNPKYLYSLGLTGMSVAQSEIYILKSEII